MSRYRWPLKTRFLEEEDEFYVLEESAIKEIEAERARSAKLLKALFWIAHETDSYSRRLILAQRFASEYEAGK